MHAATRFQIIAGLDAFGPDTRFLIEMITAGLLLGLAVALRRRSRWLRPPALLMMAAGITLDLLVPLIPNLAMAGTLDAAAITLFWFGFLRGLIRLVEGFARRDRVHFSTIFRDLATLVLWTVVAMVVLRSCFDVNINHLLAIPALLSVVVGLALQETLGNIFSGLALQLNRPFQPGDWVRSAERLGRVRGIGWRTTTIVTRSAETVEVPNAELAKQVLTVYPRHATVDEIAIGLGYDEPPNRVREVILRAVRDLPEILQTPAPVVYAWSFDDWAIHYRIKYWLADFARAEEARDQLVTSLWYALKRNQIEIPFPVQTLRMSRAPRVASADSSSQLAVELRQVDFLRALDDAELAILGGSVRVRQFGAGEILMRQGDEADAFYVIRSGTVDVSATGADGKPVHINTLTRPAFFGEAALMTGEPRNATIRAHTDVEVLEMTREGFTALFKAHPEAATRMSEIIAARMSERLGLLDSVHAADGGARARSNWLLAKMRSIFDL